MAFTDISAEDFKKRLLKWGKEYEIHFNPDTRSIKMVGAGFNTGPIGPGGYGEHMLAACMKYKGAPPRSDVYRGPIITPADAIEDAVYHLAKKVDEVGAECLRARYCVGGSTADRLLFVSLRTGQGIGRTRYFAGADIAEAFVYGRLSAVAA